MRDRAGVTVTLGGVPQLADQLRATRTRASGDAVWLEIDGLNSQFHVRRAGEWILVTGLATPW